MTEVWWWPMPAEGEIVPDHPPVEISDYFSAISFEDGLTEDGIRIAHQATTSVTYEVVDPDTPDVNPA